MGHVSVLIGVLSNIAVRRTERLHSDWFDRRTTLACKTPFFCHDMNDGNYRVERYSGGHGNVNMTGEEELRAYH